MKEVINEYNVVPLPVTMSEQQGRFYLNSDVPIVVNASQEVKHIASGLSQIKESSFAKAICTSRLEFSVSLHISAVRQLVL